MSSETSLIPLVLALDDTSATLANVGGKGASLARMVAAGLPVPPGFHITTAAYRRFVAENSLQEKILAALADASIEHPATLEDASKQIGKLFEEGGMPEAIAEAIRRAYAEFGTGDLPVAVRSSATAEDLPEMSFAGQQETYLNMRGAAMVLDAVKRCWASLWTARAIGYRLRNAIAPQDVSLAVVVQELVDAESSGVLFTVNPLTGRNEQAMIDATWGLGEALVGGLVTPDSIVVDKASGAIISQEVSDKAVMTVRTPEGTHEEPVPEQRRTMPVLDAAQATALTRLGERIEQLYGQPMDIEWAQRESHVFIVQARPITTLPASSAGREKPGPDAREWALPDPRGQYYRSSVIELLPDPLSPLFATLGLPAWNNGMSRLMREMGIYNSIGEVPIVTVNGYAYYELITTPVRSLRMALAIPSLFFTRLPGLLRTARQRWEEDALPAYRTTVERWEAENLPTVLSAQLLVGAREILNAAAHYYITIQSGILPAAYMSELWLTLVYEKMFKRRQDPVLLSLLLGYDSSPIRAEEALYDLAQWARTQNGLEHVLQNMTKTQFTAAYQTGHAEGVDEELWSIFCQRFATHLAHFGHTIYDLDFSRPVPAEEPAALLETLKFFLSPEAPDPHMRQAESAREREQAMQAILAQRGPLTAFLRRQVQRTQNFIPLREDALADAGLGWPVLRRMLREVGTRMVNSGAIAAADDIFWLTVEEVQAATLELDKGLPATRDLRAEVAERQALWKRQQQVPPPVALPLKTGARFLGIDFTNVMPSRTDQPEGDVLKGIAASPGQITGLARVIHGPDEFDQMQQGDILVARITTPAWTPLFALASGIVTDVGGPLSHSSIVAREYHIPAVLGTGVATERLRSGQRITVDGNTGLVTLQVYQS